VPGPALKPELEAYKKRVCEKYDQAKGLHDSLRNKWDRYHRQYRGYQELKKTYANRGQRDVDEILQDYYSEGYGPSLHIPYTFSVIETTLPRMLSNNPRLLITPARPEWEENVETIRLIIDRQQEASGYPLVLQDVGKSGLIYGLGVQKVMWEHRTVSTRKLVPGIYNEWVEDEATETYAGACAESVDIYDFLWDPMATSMSNCRWAIHRRWLGKEEVYDRFNTPGADGKPAWTYPDGWDWEDVCSLGSSEARTEVWSERMRMAGHLNADARGEHVHEVWEFHTGAEVIVLLDRELPVAFGPNPYWHKELPFQIFRPTRVPNELVGIGEAEAIEDLQIEMDEMRTSRRNNARLVLQRPFAYYDGLFDPGDVQFGPGAMFAVDGDPREVLQPIPLQDIPGSSYQEEARLQADIERVTGIDDTVSGGGEQQAQTATGVQLVQAAANIRIQNKTRLCEQETIKPAAHQWLRLNQQMITTENVVPGPPKPEDGDRAYSFYTVSPESLAGTYLVEPEGGATQANNPAEKMTQAQTLTMLFGQNPLVDQRAITEKALDWAGLATPQRYLAPPPPVLDETGVQILSQMLIQGGEDPATVQQAIQVAIQMAEQQKQLQAAQPEPVPSGQPPTMPGQ
jgi:hypothetical protein